MRLLILLLIAIANGCAGTTHQVPFPDSIPCAPTADDAERILARDMAETFPGAAIERVPVQGGIIRYQAKMHIALDDHIISATIIPKTDTAGAYTFLVSDFGSLIIRGPAAAQQLADKLKQDTTSFQCHPGGK